MQTLDGFLLTRQWRDGPEGLELTLWAASEAGPLRIRVTGERAVCFVPRATPPEALAGLPAPPAQRAAVALQAFDGGPVDALYFRRQRDLVAARERLRARGVRLLESDVKPVERFLMERFITAGFSARGEPRPGDGFVELRNPALRPADYAPALRWMSLDIETAGLSGALYSIACIDCDGDARAFVVSDVEVEAEGIAVQCHPDERGVIEAFLAWVASRDPDLLLGWNLVGFDLDFLERRCRRLGIAFRLGRAGERAAVLAPSGTAAQGSGSYTARIPGRVALDGIECLRTAFWALERWDLESVAQSLLGRGKRIVHTGDRVSEINRLYAHERAALVRYNVEDCRLVAEIFARADLVRFCMRRAALTGLTLDRPGGSVAAFDNLYLPRLHRRGRVAPDVADVPAGRGSPGGHVLDSRPGLYDNVLLLDFKSLYPSIIRTFRIDPLGLHAPGDDPVEGFEGARFAREGAILPELIAELWRERDAAKLRGDAPLSQAVKILMNSFYGVLGASGCRFHDPRLAASITRRGHEIIRRSRDFIEARGLQVIYGDTDSLFVLLGAGVAAPRARAEGEALADALNAWWRERIAAEHRLESFLEIELEAHFLRFLMPTVRGERTGSKKRYAGLVRDEAGEPELVFKGLESVRTDWTPLARRFQRELYRRVFLGEPFEGFVKRTLDDLLAGRLDAELVYTKRLRRPLDAYTRNVPPHVQAARKLGRPVREVRYVITPHGPEPVTADRLPEPDREHYRERQLAPAADSILHFLGTSFAAITDRQIEIF